MKTKRQYYRDRARRLVKNFKDSSADLSWEGSQDPSMHEVIQNAYRTNRTILLRFIDALIDDSIALDDMKAGARDALRELKHG